MALFEQIAHTPAVPAVSRLARVMARAGWEVHYVEIDLTRDLPQAEIKVMRGDGRWLWAKVDGIGRCTVERFQRALSLSMADDTKGRRPLSPQVTDNFMGRQSYPGARAMLRSLTAYLADNAMHPIALADVRAAWAPLMGGPLLLDHTTTKEQQ